MLAASGELGAAVASAFQEGQGHVVGADGRLQRIVQQLALLRRNVAVSGAMLDQEGRGLSGYIGDRIDRFGLLGHALDRRAKQLRFGRVGCIVRDGAGGAGKLRIHLQEIGRTIPVHYGLNTTRLVGIAQLCTLQGFGAARSAQQGHQAAARRIAPGGELFGVEMILGSVGAAGSAPPL